MVNETWIQKLKRKSHELLKGEKAYLSKEHIAEMKKVKSDTTRTKSTKSALEQAGLTKDEIAKLQGKYKTTKTGKKVEK